MLTDDERVLLDRIIEIHGLGLLLRELSVMCHVRADAASGETRRWIAWQTVRNLLQRAAAFAEGGGI